MPRRSSTRDRGSRSSGQNRLVLVVAILFVSWVQLASASAAAQQQQQRAAVQQPDDHEIINEQRVNERDPKYAVQDIGYDGAIDDTPQVSPNQGRKTQPSASQKKHLQYANNRQHDNLENSGRSARAKRSLDDKKNINNIKNKKSNNENLYDASALATLAPAQPVRAPSLPGKFRSSSTLAAGLSSPQIARSLEDWEVEDFVLLATVDGDLYATGRTDGKEHWRLEVDQPMIETKHFRSNVSVLDDDYSPIDHYLWAVEPARDGLIYAWIPEPGVGLVRTSFTMKRLVEELAPFADENPAVVYTGDKKTTLITLDAATGRVLKWFGSGGSHVNEAESCLRPDYLYNADSVECSSTGTITLGRTEYTVGIQRRDGKPIATLKYAEWVPNNYDADLYTNYQTSLDSRYITSQHDGKVYAFDYDPGQPASPKFSQQLSSPVARVFDVCRPWDAPRDSHPELVVLPQPTMPTKSTEVARTRSNSIFLNHTITGDWYAMSGRSYPLIIDAPLAKVSHRDVWEHGPGSGEESQVLVGTHFLDSLMPSGENIPATLPAGPMNGYDPELAEEDWLPVVVSSDKQDVGLVGKVKLLPQSALESVMDLLKNPFLILIVTGALMYYGNKFRRMSDSERRELIANMYSSAGSKVHPKLGPVTELAPQKAQNQVGQKEALTEASNGQEDVSIVKSTETGATPAVTTSGVVVTHSEGNGASEAVVVDPEAARPGSSDEASPEKKKARRGRRGGVKHKKGRGKLDNSNLKPTDTTGRANGVTMRPDITTVRTGEMEDVDDGTVLRLPGLLVYQNKVLGNGTNGTTVHSGEYDGRKVAVKRLLLTFYEIAQQETKLLKESDDHPNVIRYFNQQEHEGFIYIALELCDASLADIVEKPQMHRELAEAGRMDLPGILYQITNGIAHLHSLRIVHRDLKPQNVMACLGKTGKPRMLVADFGLCKKLDLDQSSFGTTHGRAAGTTGWRAPELLYDDDKLAAAVSAGARNFHSQTSGLDTQSGSGSILVGDDAKLMSGRRATRAIDVFALGLIFFYVLTNGQHPYDCGDRYMREVNIRRGNYDLSPLDSLGDFAWEAKDLISSMLHEDPKKRPAALSILSHPFFWSAKKKLAFLCDVSDHFEKECRDPPSYALQELESHAAEVIRGDFLRILPQAFVDSLGKQRRYTGTRMLDLLRALRNKRNHYEDMSDSLKKAVEVGWQDTDRFVDYYLPAGL
ncbi:Serine/threonine-protein kinase-like protein [Emericellopsis cladophorae]|uniref:non-specific serine/threonine protein kinase n=1 Tax=Emericellopsis cladophorae TaxID=2686198 RepID=A0A9P9Y3E9_9HYPO|nr:Serine/threonine-protein kinase-like protein [Emericellopsis cladophorae]KAI6782620.1 Serine/threonine-protein kinase-like protein [Emericellopsis cladophorae]